MQVLHTLGDVTVSKEIHRDTSFLLGNKLNGYAYFSTDKKSRYNGVFFQTGSNLYKVIADITIEQKPEKLVNKFHTIQRHTQKNIEYFLTPYGYNSIAYELEKEDWITLFVDVRKSYDTSNPVPYEIFTEDKSIIIKCKRYETEFFISIRSKKPGYEKIDEFISVYNERDQKRNSLPFEMPAYKAIRIKSKKLIISFSEDKNAAIKESTYIYNNIGTIKKTQKKHINSIISKKTCGSDETWMAYNCCINSLDQLTSPDGIIAGLPWFFQLWTRDELISLKNTEKKIKKTILSRDLNYIIDDGRIPNLISNPGNGNADSVGWLFKRIDESLEIFTNKERGFIKDKLMESIMRLNETHVKDYMVFNNPQETWMDSLFKDDGRKGARIEIQAMLLNMYRMARRLTGNEKFLQIEKILRDKIRDSFWDDNYLKDGLNDPTIRPNQFIAAYMYPELLTKEEWTTCFKSILPRLWCEWGGLSTIDSRHELYTEYSTGEDSRSYHRGDSWYFLNNMAAMILYKTNSHEFKKYIQKIMAASTEDILWNGMIGHHSEISSSKEQRAEGCGAQAWSAAMYIELIDELFLK